MASILTPELLRRLEQFQLLAARRAKSSARGERRSRARGQSVEFADYRNYVPGDDFRYLDWNVYARLERLFVKLFVEEEDVTVTLLIDASASMGFADGGRTRLAQASALAEEWLDTLPANSRANIVWARARPECAVPEPAPNLEFLRQALRQATVRAEIADVAGTPDALATLPVGATTAAGDVGLSADGLDAATSPALVFRAGDSPLLAPAGRRVGEREAVASAGRSKADRSTHPSRDTRTQPFGAGASPTDTLVPASNDATLRAAAAPRVRRTAGRLPTRVPADVR